jgi:hypothetical protein
MDEPNPRGTQGLYRLPAAAKRAGLSPDLFVKAAERGDIPITPVRIGRLIFVRVSELEAWLQPAERLCPAPAEVNLF